MIRTAHWNLVAVVATLFLLGLALAPASVGAQSQPMRFGMNLSSIAAQNDAGVKPDLGMIWIGPWTLQSGWGGPDQEFQTASASGVTPVIQFYYWGDDISQACLEKGCRSSLHAAEKNKSNWTRLAEQLAQHLNTQAKGKPAVIILESEFNKNDVSTYEPLDGYLAEKAAFFKQAYPSSEIVLGLGNWGHAQWGTWDRAAAASHATGIQGMRASTKNSATSYQGLAQATLDGARELRDRFHKPIYVTDIALSSYPEPDYLALQKQALAPFFGRIAEFKALGVKGMLYRGLYDSPNMDTKNYFGEAERHWGLAWAGNRTHKPAMRVWIDGVKTERGAPAASSSAPPPPPPPFAPTFEIKAPNEWWQEVFIRNADGHTIGRVELRRDGGAWQTLAKRDWGAWTSSYNTKTGSKVEFRATTTTGATATSMPFTWMDEQTTKGTSGAAPTTSPAPSTSPSPTPTTSPTPTATPTPSLPITALHKEGESFATRSAGALGSDETASGGQYWKLDRNGQLADRFSTTQGTHRITVWAGAETFLSDAPRMQVLVDGVVVMDVAVTGDWAAYSVDRELLGGAHELSIAYTNDASGLLEDRNLLLDRALVQRTS
jgi:hypothetical protein